MKYFLGGKIKDEMGGACRAHEEKCMHEFGSEMVEILA
jgi:hypothetical protein